MLDFILGAMAGWCIGAMMASYYYYVTYGRKLKKLEIAVNAVIENTSKPLT